jgi:hypothetical protein
MAPPAHPSRLASDRHDEYDQARLISAADLHHRLAEAVGDPGGNQSFANDRHRRNQHHDRLAEASQRFLYRLARHSD